MTYFLRRTLTFALLPLTIAAVIGTAAFGQGAKVSQFEPQDDDDGDKPAEREQWFYRGRHLHGESAAALRHRAHVQKMQMRAARMQTLRTQSGASPLTSGAGAAWTPLGPAPLASDSSGYGLQDYGAVSGRATAIAIDPNDTSGNTVYVGGAYGGVWKSTNAGLASQSAADVKWTPLVDDRETLAVGAIAVQPGQSDSASRVILVGTGEPDSSADSYYGLGILRSDNGGTSWTLITESDSGAHAHPFAGLGFSQIAFSTANPNLVVAATANTNGYYDDRENPVFANRGLYYSTDAGVTWHFAAISDGSTPIPVSSVVFNEGAGKFFAAIRYHGMYSSADGANWTRLPNQPGTALTLAACPTAWTATCPLYRGEFAVVPGRNEMYSWYVSVDSSASPTQIRDQGIWQSLDGGNSWNQINDSPIANCGDLAGCGVSQGAYDLALLAMPDGSATDLYAGAVNLYKCTITNSDPSCNGQGSNTFLNLTHAYGCPPFYGSIAHVHPDQHALDAMVVNGKAAMYFANDGGVYRALDGYTGLISGDCSVPNQFDDLNQTLGSMTQFVAFSQSPTDANTLLGGTHDNGSPATSTAQNSSWLNVNSGDGGYNAINPDNPSEWFTANTGVSIQVCEAGVACHSQAGATDPFIQIVDSSTLGNDAGPFYTPYILDPQNSGELIVGTCRVWRGTTAGTSFSALSNNFDPGGGVPCSNSQVNTVRALAAGGPKDVNGFSNVIYAGTDGYGPNANTSPSGGHLWVTKNAAGGPSTWSDQSGGIDPLQFPISAVAIDTTDPTGQTAYVSIMGFNTSHVWQTTDAGATWTDFTGSLPDSPANALALDSGSTTSNGTIYVGTDEGVFSSSTGSPGWTEVGPAPVGATGFLPNVAVTALRLFHNGGTKLLRVSTYGRGMWQFPLATSPAPDYSLAILPTSQTANVGASATFTGTLTSLNGYASLVNLNGCTAAGAPPTCTIVPAIVTPTSLPGAPFTITVSSNIVQSYNFTITGTGTDVGAVMHSQPLIFNAVNPFDFSFSASPPLTQTIPAGQTASYNLTATPLDENFPAAVSFSCAALPSGASCSFNPSQIPSGAGSTPIVLQVSTTSSTPAGAYTVSPTASLAGGRSHTQNLSLTVTGGSSSPDYSIAVSSPTQTAIVGSSATFTGTLTSLNGYSSTVNLSGCAPAANVPPTCTISPATLTPTATGASFTITAASNVSQSYSFNITATGTDSAMITHSQVLTFNSFDFIFTTLTASQTVTAGSPANYTLDLKPLAGTFPAPVSFSCAISPSLNLGSCSVPTPVNPGSGESTVSLTVITIAPILALKSGGRTLSLYLLMSLPLAGLLFICPRGKRFSTWHKRLAFLVPIAAIMSTMVPLCACGSGLSGNGGHKGDQPGTTPGTYTVTVKATMAGLAAKSVPLTLTVN